jgi:DNA-binding LacI/PurR family transcriptional regulator
VKGTASVRLQGYRTALTKAELPYDPRLVLGVKQYTRAAGKDAMQRLLRRDDPPDAVFCFNDLMAIGALRACAEAGVTVPDDIAIAGFDNIPEGAYTTPTLTTVDADLDILSREALRLLLARIAGSHDPVERVQVLWQLQLRESTKCI